MNHITKSSQVLRFRCFFKQRVENSPLEQFRVRTLILSYFLEDESLQLAEPQTPNSGIDQGLFLNRSRVSKPDGSLFGPRDFICGRDICLHSRVYRICSMDEYTRKFYSSSGIDPGIECEIPSCLSDRGRPDFISNPTSHSAPKIIKSLDDDGKVLSFESFWDDLADFGFRHYFELHWFLGDDTIELIEVFPRTESNAAHRAVFLRRKSARDLNVSLRDLIIGNSMNMLSRTFHIYNCDRFTTDYFMTRFNIEQRGTPMFLDEVKTKRVLQESDRLVPRRPPLDTSKLDQSTILLRFKARLTKSEYERNFIIGYYPVDETLAAWEIPTRNSGIVGGKFAERGTKRKSDGSAYKLTDISQPGSRIRISGSEFEVIEPDEFTKKWLNDHVYIIRVSSYGKSRNRVSQ